MTRDSATIDLRCKGAGIRKDYESGKQENRKTGRELRDRDRVGCLSKSYFAGETKELGVGAY
jgi:hypothetical protein